MNAWIQLFGEVGLALWEAFKKKAPAIVPTPHRPDFGSIEREEEEALKRKRQTQDTKP